MRSLSENVLNTLVISVPGRAQCLCDGIYPRLSSGASAFDGGLWRRLCEVMRCEEPQASFASKLRLWPSRVAGEVPHELLKKRLKISWENLDRIVKYNKVLDRIAGGV
ncbi:hypothetical protein O3P69_011462 [Scylla paramamosain]|uniref:Uncharacterized protein n=1 Tax=Scylla paramamosain TaxID=85552 RepID=A0AAW0T7I7_SCYPA